MVDTDFGSLELVAKRSNQFLLVHTDDDTVCRIYDEKQDTISGWNDTASVAARGYWKDDFSGKESIDLTELLSSAELTGDDNVEPPE
jgi:hypothetical protein